MWYMRYNTNLTSHVHHVWFLWNHFVMIQLFFIHLFLINSHVDGNDKINRVSIGYWQYTYRCHHRTAMLFFALGSSQWNIWFGNKSNNVTSIHNYRFEINYISSSWSSSSPVMMIGWVRSSKSKRTNDPESQKNEAKITSQNANFFLDAMSHTRVNWNICFIGLFCCISCCSVFSLSLFIFVKK